MKSLSRSTPEVRTRRSRAGMLAVYMWSERVWDVMLSGSGYVCGGEVEGEVDRKLLQDFEIWRVLGEGLEAGSVGGRADVEFEIEVWGRGESIEVVVEGAGEWWSVVEVEVILSSVSDVDVESPNGDGARGCSNEALADEEARCRERIVCVM